MRSSMHGTDVAAGESHTIRASDKEDTAGAGLSSGQPTESQASNLLVSSTSTVTSVGKPALGLSLPDSSNSSTVGNKKKLVPLSSPLGASDPRLAARTKGRIIEGSRADTSDSPSGVLPKVTTETSSAASSLKLAPAAPASDPEGMKETPIDAQARSEAVVPARNLNTDSKATVQSCEEAAASESSNRPTNTQDSSMVGGAAPEACIKSGTETSAPMSTQISVDGGSTSGENLTTVSGTEAAAPDTNTSSEIGHGMPTSTSAPTSVPEVMTVSGPSVSNPGGTAHSSGDGTRTNPKSVSTQGESGEGRSTLGTKTGSKAVVAVKKPVSGSSCATPGVAINTTSASKGGPAEPRSSLKKQPQQRVPKAMSVSMTDVVDALSGPLSARRTTQASVAAALDSSRGVTQNESGPRVSENKRDVHEEEAFRTRLTEELVTMMKAMGGFCKMSTIASKYMQIFRRQLFLGGRKLRNLLENDGGLAGIILDDSTDGGVIRLGSPTDSTFATSGMKLTRTIVNKKALKHGGHSSLEDGSSGRTADASKTLSVNTSVRSDAKSRGSKSPGEDDLERRDSEHLHNKPHQSSTKATRGSDRALTTCKTSLAIDSRKEHPEHPASTTTIREHDILKLDKKAKNEGKTKRGRSPGRSRSYDSRYLEGRSSTKRDRTRDAVPKQSRDLVDGRFLEGKYAHAGHRRDEREERIRRTRSTRSRSKSVNLRKARSDSRSPNSYASSRRSVDSQSLARSRHGRKRSDAGVSSARRYGHDRGQSGMDLELPVTAVRVKHEEHASGDETVSRKGDYRQEDYHVKNSARVPTRGSNYRGDFSEHLPYVGAERDSYQRGETRDSYQRDGASNGIYVFEDRRGVRVESAATSSKRRLTDGVDDVVFDDAHTNGDRPTKRYATTALGRGIEGQPSSGGGASRGERPVHTDDGMGGMHTDVPMRALLPSPGTIQPVPLSGDHPQGARLIIKGTHPAVPERKIHALASAYGTVGKIEVLEEFVFVHMKYLEEAERAVVGLSGRLLPNVSAGRNVPLMAAVWREEMYQALMSMDNMRRYADSMRKASTWYEKHRNLMLEGRAEGSVPCRFFALGRGCVFGDNCELIHENYFQAGVTRDALGRSAIANGAPPDPLALSSSLPPGRHEMVGGEHPVVRHRVSVNDSRKKHSRDVFVQNDEHHSRPPTSIRGRQQPEPSGGMDVVPSIGVLGSWRSEHRGPEQTNLPRARTGSIDHAFDGMRAKTRIDPYRGEGSIGYTTNRIGDRPEQEYRNAKQGGVILGKGREHVAKRHHSLSPRRGSYESRERAFSRKGTTRDGASRHGIGLDAIDDVHFGLRSAGRERTDSRSSSMERPRSRGSITRRNGHDGVHRYDKTDRRDPGVSRHKRDTDIVALDRHDRDFYRRDRDTSRRSRDVSRRDHDITRHGRRDGRREREDSYNSSRSGSGGGYPRDSRGGKRDGRERGHDYHDKKRRSVRGGKRRGPVRDESESSKERFDDRSESRIGDRGQRRAHSRSLSNRGRRGPSHDKGMRARSSEKRIERDNQRGSRREGREQEVVFSGLRAGGGYEEYESGRSFRQDHRAAGGDDEMLDNQKIRQEFPDFDDELMGDSKAVDDDVQVKTTFTVTACLDPQTPQLEAASAPSTTFSVTMPLDPTDVLKHRASRDEGQGGKQGRGGGARGGRGTRGRGSRGGRGSYQQRDGAYRDA